MPYVQPRRESTATHGANRNEAPTAADQNETRTTTSFSSLKDRYKRAAMQKKEFAKPNYISNGKIKKQVESWDRDKKPIQAESAIGVHLIRKMDDDDDFVPNFFSNMPIRPIDYNETESERVVLNDDFHSDLARPELGIIAPIAPVADNVSNFNALRVVDDKVLRGSRPKYDGEHQVGNDKQEQCNYSEDAVKELKGHGVSLVVSFNEHDPMHVENLAKSDIAFEHFKTNDFKAASAEEYKQMYDKIKRTEGKVFIHCGAGWGRTGTAVTAYQILDGKLKSSDLEKRMTANSVENNTQRTVLRELCKEKNPDDEVEVKADDGVSEASFVGPGGNGDMYDDMYDDIF